MGEEFKRLDALRDLGYSEVYIWDAKPEEEDLEHVHDFDTHLEILRGEIQIVLEGKVHLLSVGLVLDIPRGVAHAGLVGKDGCRYIVAERH